MEVFEPSSLAGVKLKNRIFRSATHEGVGQSRGFRLDELKDRYVRLAQGGVGAIITGYTGVCRSGKAWPNMLMIDDDDAIPDFSQITAALKPYGTPLFLQLAHGGGRTDPTVTGSPTKAPSKHHYKGAVSPAAQLTETDIRAIILNFAQAVDRARRSGFDGVQLHAAHGYLLSAFLSPRLNTRSDRWGGSTENRFRMIREIITLARETVGSYPIMVKFSAYDFERNGLRLEEAVRLATLFQEASFDAIEISCGNEDWFSAIRTPQIPVDAILAFEPTLKEASWLKRRLASLLIPHLFKTHRETENYNIEAAAIIKAHIDIPVIVVGGIRNLSTISDIIGRQKADYVSLCRPFILEPDLVDKLKTGRQEASRCLNCNYCLLGVTANPLRCYYGRIPE
ncbi:MAG: NADH:flavin oxidoreductase [Negativicutes bacterium]|nr:NADH:flavin oxidoreductase [Negativicutes bacterium]